MRSNATLARVFTSLFASKSKNMAVMANTGPNQIFGIAAITYYSARTDKDVANVELFTPEALRFRKHRNPRHGLAETREDGVSFRFSNVVYSFRRKDFLHNGQFPIPA